MMTSMLLLFFLLLILPLLVVYVVRKSRSSIIPNWPLIGMVPSLLWHVYHNLLHDLITQILQQNRGTFFFKGPIFTNLNFFLTSDPINLHHIFSRNFPNFPKGSDLKEIMEPLGDGIFNTDGDSWKMQREMIHSLINTSKFEHLLLKTLQRKLDSALLPILHNASTSSSSHLDLQDLMKRFTFDTICILVLGFDPQFLSMELPHLDYADAFDVIEEVIVYRHCVPQSMWKLQKWLRIGEEAKMRKASECFVKFLDERIKVKKLEMQKQGNNDDDFLTQLILETQRIGKSGVFLRDAAFNLLVAGRDTIAAALTWFFWLVAINPAVEDSILEEMDRVIITGRNSIIPSLEELDKLVYLKGAISETLRLYPSVPFEHKQSLEADVLPSGHAIRSNTRIVLSLYSIGRMEEIWGKDCMEFKPERWVIWQSSSEEEKKIVHVPSYKFPAFLAGPRTCLGRKIAFTQMKVIASSVLRLYKIEVVEGHPVVPVPSILLFMRYGLKIKVSQRTSFALYISAGTRNLGLVYVRHLPYLDLLGFLDADYG
ncbi:Alkane hydroxylase MAH1, partial [Linum perenne]